MGRGTKEKKDVPFFLRVPAKTDRKTKEPESVLSGLEGWITTFESELKAAGGLKEWNPGSGIGFISPDAQEFLNKLGMRHSRIDPEMPQVNASTELGNASLVKQA